MTNASPDLKRTRLTLNCISLFSQSPSILSLYLDPFMYYSIPGVLQASLNLEDVDYSDIASLSQAGSHPSSSRPTRRSQEEAEDDATADANASKVSRRTRVSFECHPNVLLEGVMDELEQEFGDLLLDLDDIVSMLGSKSGSVSTMQ